MARQLASETWTAFVARLSRNFSLVIVGLGSYAFATRQVIAWQIVIVLALCSLFSIWPMYTHDSYRPTHRKEHDMLRELINQLAYLRDRAFERFLSSPELPTWEDNK